MAKTVSVEFLAGEIHALVTFAQVLATTHHDHKRLLSDLQSAEQVGLANVETVLATDKLVLGYQYAIGRVRAALEAAMGNSPDHDRD